MSFFSKFFRCCESNLNIQNETKSELIILQGDKKSPPLQIPKEDVQLPSSPILSDLPKKARVTKKELSFVNLEVTNGCSSPKKKPLKLNLKSAENDVSNDIEQNPDRAPRKELSFINIEVMNPYQSPRKKPNGQKKPEENFEELDNLSLASPVSKKKKEKGKMDFKFATLGEFEINNIEKKKPAEGGGSPRFTEAKSIKSALNEEDCDIALVKKPYKKFQTTQDDHKHQRNSQVLDLINLKKQMKEMEKNNDDATPIFDHTKNPKFG